MRSLQSRRSQSSAGFMVSAMLHALLIYGIWHNPFRINIGNDEAMTVIDMDVFAEVSAPNFADEIITAAAAQEMIDNVMQENMVEEIEEILEEEIIEEEIIEEKIEDLVVIEEKKPVEKKKEKPKKKAEAKVATAQVKPVTQSKATNSGGGSAAVAAAPTIGEMNMQNSRGDSRFQKILAAIQKNKQYPASARRMRKQGTVTVSFMVSTSGGVSNIRVVGSSGSKDLDNATIECVKKASRLFPAMERMTKVTVPLKYELI